MQSERKHAWLQGLVEHRPATVTYALEQIVQLADSLPLLPLYAANPDAWSVNGPFAPNGSAILHSP